MFLYICFCTFRAVMDMAKEKKTREVLASLGMVYSAVIECDRLLEVDADRYPEMSNAAKAVIAYF